MCRGLDHEQHPNVVTRQIGDRFRDDRDAAERREFIEQHQNLAREGRVVLGQRSCLQSDRLLEEQGQHGTQTVQIIRIHADIDRQGFATQLAQIEVIRRRGGIQNRVQPQVESRGKCLSDAGRGYGREVDHVVKRSDTL